MIKEIYERYEDLNCDWEEEKENDETGVIKNFDKFKEKAARRYLLEGYKKILNPEISKYEKRYELDDEEECEFFL